jgi:TonB-linked SusC/RagA family outer membrane protein
MKQTKKLLFLTLCMILGVSVVFGQRTVTGTVISDDTRETLPFVSVQVKGTPTGIATSIDGVFSITVPSAEAILVFTFVGYQTLELRADVSKPMSVRMKLSAEMLEAVVITGLFDRPGESFTGSARMISSQELMTVGSTNVFQSLRNIDPSLIMMDNFEFGSDPNRMPGMELRGTSSFNMSGLSESGFRSMYQSDPNQPLFILDGFETNITRIYDLDMSRVESMTILKDAAAKAIYGAKAANGVVVIETRRGLEGEFRVTYRGSVDIEIPDLTSYNLTNALEKLQVEWLGGVYNPNSMLGLPDAETSFNDRMNKALAGLNTDWLSKPLRTGVGTRHAVAFDMTHQLLNVMADISYNNRTGVMKGSDRTTIAGSMNATYRTSDRRFVFRNEMNITSNNASDSPYGTFGDYVRMNPYHDPYDTNGRLLKNFPSIAAAQNNPLWNAQLNTMFTSGYLNFSNNFITEYSPIENLKFRVRVGLVTQRNERDRFYPAEHTRFLGMTSETDRLRRGLYSHGVGRMNRYSGDFSVQYNKAINDHLLMTNFAYNIGETGSYELDYEAEGFPSDKMNSMMFARAFALDGKPRGSENTVRDLGVVGVLGYSYDNRYMADVTLRTGASSQYAPDKRWGMFWSTGVGWNVHNEKWAKNINWFDRLKLRSSIGSTGTQNISSYLTITTYNYYTDNFYRAYREQNPFATELGVHILRLANDELLWQQKLDFNIGFETTIARLTASFDYYIETTNNLVTDLSIPPSTGFRSISENAGQVENKGIDLSLNYQLIKKRDFFLNISGAFSLNTNKLKKISDALRSFNDLQDALVSSNVDGGRWNPVRRYVEGSSMNAIWAVPSLGINPQNGNEIYVRPDGTTTYVWSAANQQIVGDHREKYRGNLGISGEYKGFGASLTCRFLGGGQLYNSTLVQRVENANIYENVDKRVFDGRWSEDNRFAPYKRLQPYRDANGNWVSVPFTQPTSRFVQNRNEFDIASVNIYYNLHRFNVIKQFGFTRLRVAFNMNELHKFSSIKVERGTSYPFARTLSFSVTAEF